MGTDGPTFSSGSDIETSGVWGDNLKILMGRRTDI